MVLSAAAPVVAQGFFSLIFQNGLLLAVRTGDLVLEVVRVKLDSATAAGALTWICTTNFRLRKPACRTDYTLRAWHP